MGRPFNTVNGSIVKRVSQTTFLGIGKIILTIYIYAKISEVIGILYKTKQMLSSKSLLIVYDSLIKPYFSYHNHMGKYFQNIYQQARITS